MPKLHFAKIFVGGIAAYFLAINAYATNAILCVPPPKPGNIGDVLALKSCINTANSLSGGTIDLGGLVYTLTTADNIADGANGLPDITSDIVLKNGTITKDPSLPFRHLHVSDLGSLSLKNITLMNGLDTSGNGGGAIFVKSGGILATVEESNFTNNQMAAASRVVAAGGALYILGEFIEIKKTIFANNQAVGISDGSVGGAIFIAGPGGTISESIFSANVAVNEEPATSGGAIYVSMGGSINAIVASSFIANSSPGENAGAIYVEFAPGIGTIDGCTFSFNNSPGGGALFLDGPIGTISNSTFDNNIAVNGAAIFLFNAGGPFVGSIQTIYNCTLNANFAFGVGGAIYLASPATIGQIYNSTVAGNQAQHENGGAGLYNCGIVGSMVSNIWADNLDTNTTPGTEDDVYNNCGGTINAASFNLVGVDTNTNGAFDNGVNGNTGNIVGSSDSPINPNLGVLSDNGGPTKTMAPLSNSPAIGAGANPLGLAHDQRGRGFSRMLHGQTDIGALEIQRSRE